jgi:hypothetical protein
MDWTSQEQVERRLAYTTAKLVVCNKYLDKFRELMFLADMIQLDDNEIELRMATLNEQMEAEQDKVDKQFDHRE